MTLEHDLRKSISEVAHQHEVRNKKLGETLKDIVEDLEWGSGEIND